MTTASVLCGCASPTRDVDTDPTNAPRPIDRVRIGIADVRERFDHTARAARDLLEASDPDFRQRRMQYGRELDALEQSLKTLRADAKDLRERASEYLALWSGQTVTVTAGGSVGGRTDERREKIKAAYDGMVKSMLDARDRAAPLLVKMRSLQQQAVAARNGDEVNAASPQLLPEISEASDRVRADLADALAALDRLERLVASRSRS